MELTYSNDICVGLVHFDVIFLGPAQADLHPELEFGTISSEPFPFCHEHLKIGNGT